jgi:hypothetical protein
VLAGAELAALAARDKSSNNGQQTAAPTAEPRSILALRLQA